MSSFMDKAKDALDGAKEKAEEIAAEHGDTVEQAIDKASQAITDRTGGDTDAKVRDIAGKAKDAVRDLAEDGRKKRP